MKIDEWLAGGDRVGAPEKQAVIRDHVRSIRISDISTHYIPFVLLGWYGR
jgi:hypothetical protein